MLYVSFTIKQMKFQIRVHFISSGLQNNIGEQWQQHLIW